MGSPLTWSEALVDGIRRVSQRNLLAGYLCCLALSTVLLALLQLPLLAIGFLDANAVLGQSVALALGLAIFMTFAIMRSKSEGSSPDVDGAPRTSTKWDGAVSTRRLIRSVVTVLVVAGGLWWAFGPFPAALWLLFVTAAALRANRTARP